MTRLWGKVSSEREGKEPFRVGIGIEKPHTIVVGRDSGMVPGKGVATSSSAKESRYNWVRYGKRHCGTMWVGGVDYLSRIVRESG